MARISFQLIKLILFQCRLIINDSNEGTLMESSIFLLHLEPRVFLLHRVAVDEPALRVVPGSSISLPPPISRFLVSNEWLGQFRILSRLHLSSLWCQFQGGDNSHILRPERWILVVIRCFVRGRSCLGQGEMASLMEARVLLECRDLHGTKNWWGG